MHQSVERNAHTLPFDPGVRKRMTGLRARFVDPNPIQGNVGRASVVNHSFGSIGIAELDVMVPKLHRLRYDGGIQSMPLLD